jgi:hypothetical protein
MIDAWRSNHPPSTRALVSDFGSDFRLRFEAGCLEPATTSDTWSPWLRRQRSRPGRSSKTCEATRDSLSQQSSLGTSGSQEAGAL